MLIDTHCHLNMVTKKTFDALLTSDEITSVESILKEASAHTVTAIINIGTSVIESRNCITLAQKFPSIFAVVGIHPNDLTDNWQTDFKEIQKMISHKDENRIVGIGECGLDFHYPNYNKQRQYDAFKAQIELALEYNIALVVHTRNAPDETLAILEAYKGQITKGIIHCFSEDNAFAQTVIEWGFVLGIGGIITYPKNNYLRDIVKSVALTSFVLETDTPFLPIQSMRGKQNLPQYIYQIAQFIAQQRNESFEAIAHQTTKNAQRIFSL
jgi:TatD DNase family protein